MSAYDTTCTASSVAPDGSSSGVGAPPRWHGLDRPSLDAAYDNQAAVPAFAALTRARRERAEQLRRDAGARVDLAYGDGARQCLDFFPSTAAGAPLLVFVHGGYWQGGEKGASGFIAAGPLARGFAVAVLEYTVAPTGSLPRMADEVCAAIAWLGTAAGRFGFDPARIVLAGHSAGAQLLCLALDLPGVIGGLAISGIYELEPIRLGRLNGPLGLTPADVAHLSPARRPPRSGTTLIVAVGEAELPELRWQSREFVAVAQAGGVDARLLALAGHDHFSILDALAEQDGALCAELDRLRSPEVRP